MKKIKFISVLIFCFCLLIGTNACVVISPKREAHKTHRGWNKNSNNPHHQHSTNPGKSKGKHR